MKTLVLMRHAKSDWGTGATDDHGRPLNGRGRAAAPLTGRWLAGRGIAPDIVLCSSALRTRETAALLAGAMPGLPEPVVERELYHAGPETLRALLARLPAGIATAMVVGHEPGLSALLGALADGSEPARLRGAFEKFPTAAAAVLEIADGWQTLAAGQARFVDFVTPRELAGG